MNRDDIIRMAREAGFTLSRVEWVYTEMLERFFHAAYAEGAAEEREACAKACEDYTDNGGGTFADHEGHGYELAQRIRARGNT